MASIVIHEAPAEVVQQAQHILESHHEHMALDAAESPPDEAGVASEVSQDVEDVSGLHAQKADSGAISGVGAPVRAGADWRERAGIGKTARARHS